MRKRITVLVSAMAMMLMMAMSTAMAYPVQVNTGDAVAANSNATYQLNAAAQSNKQLAIKGSNYSNQEQNQANLNATEQNAAAFAGNIFALGY